MPRLSFVIPTHNRTEMLLASVASVVEQTVDDWELIIVDDGSAEAVQNILDESDERIILHRNPTPLGAAASRNIGARLAGSDFVAFLDDDDTLKPEYATRMLAFFSEHGGRIGFAWPVLKVIDKVESKEFVAQDRSCLIYGSAGTEEAFVATAYVRTTGMMFCAKTFKTNGGFDESLAVSEDREFVFRLLSSGIGCGCLQEKLVNFFVHGGPRLSTDENLQRQAECDTRVLERHKEFLLSHPKLASRYLNLVAKRQKVAGWRGAYEQTLKALIRRRLLDVRAWRRLLVSKLWNR